MMPPHPHQTAPQVPCVATHEQAAGAPGHTSSQAGPQAGGRAESPPPARTQVSPRWAPCGGQGTEGLTQAKQGRSKGRVTSTPHCALPQHLPLQFLSPTWSPASLY